MKLFVVKVRLYASQDERLNGWWLRNLFANVLDVGAFGQWFRLERYFVDNDVNEEEFPAES